MGLILKCLKKYKGLFLLNLISVFGFALVEIGIPTIVAKMIDVGVSTGNTAYLYQQGGVIFLISVIGVCGTLTMGFCCAKISTSITRDIRNEVFEKIQTFSRSEFNKFGVSSLITRTNNDAFQIQMFVNVILRTALLTPVMICVSFFMTIRASSGLVADHFGDGSFDRTRDCHCGKGFQTDLGESAGVAGFSEPDFQGKSDRDPCDPGI